MTTGSVSMAPDDAGAPAGIDEAYLAAYGVAGQLPVWISSCRALETGKAGASPLT